MTRRPPCTPVLRPESTGTHGCVIHVVCCVGLWARRPRRHDRRPWRHASFRFLFIIVQFFPGFFLIILDDIAFWVMSLRPRELLLCPSFFSSSPLLLLVPAPPPPSFSPPRACSSSSPFPLLPFLLHQHLPLLLFFLCLLALLVSQRYPPLLVPAPPPPSPSPPRARSYYSYWWNAPYPPPLLFLRGSPLLMQGLSTMLPQAMLQCYENR